MADGQVIWIDGRGVIARGSRTNCRLLHLYTSLSFATEDDAGMWTSRDCRQNSELEAHG
jgi:hypothetical protein